MLSRGRWSSDWILWRDTEPSEKGDPRRGLKTVKILMGAIFALLAITYAMRSLGERLDGALPHEPSLMERIVLYFAN
ncbi:MAG TPA: hypothetical protein VF146_05460 [Bryobacteraceae bacterium]